MRISDKNTGLTHDRLLERLTYNPLSGDFIWTTYKGRRYGPKQIAGSLHSSGYVKIMLDGFSYCSHRLAWFYVHKVWPTDEIDHINGVKDDNRICNLREATRTNNNHNVRMMRKNKSGYRGVYARKDRNGALTGRWCAVLAKKRIGDFPTARDASLAYEAAARELHGDFYRPPTPPKSLISP